MHDASPTISLPAIVALLRRNAWLILITFGLAIAASIALSVSTEEEYTAEATVGFNDNSAELQALGVPAAPSFQPDKEAAAQAERITRPDVVAEVRESLGLDESISDIQDAISTRVEVSSNLVTITAEASSGVKAAQIANAFARTIREDATERTVERYEAAAKESRRRARRLRGADNAGRRAVYEDQSARLLALADFAEPVEIVRSAQVPDSPTSPKPVRNAVLAGILGLMLGTGLTFVRQAFDRQLREQDEAQRHLDAPIVGVVQTTALGKSPLAAAEKDRTSDEDVEAFRILRPNVNRLHDADAGGDGAHVVLVSSPLPEEGKSTVSAGLAWAEAITGRRTLFVDCDLRRPTVADRLGVAPVPGLSDFLAGEAGPADVLRSVDAGRTGSQLVVIPAGRPRQDHAELLESERFRDFLAEVRQVYDLVILDSAPLLPVSDTLQMLPLVDTVLVCLRLGQTTRDDADAARSALASFPDLPIGAVLTAADKSRGTYYAGGYGYEPRPAAAAR